MEQAPQPREIDDTEQCAFRHAINELFESHPTYVQDMQGTVYFDVSGAELGVHRSLSTINEPHYVSMLHQLSKITTDIDADGFDTATAQQYWLSVNIYGNGATDVFSGYDMRQKTENPNFQTVNGVIYPNAQINHMKAVEGLWRAHSRADVEKALKNFNLAAQEYAIANAIENNLGALALKIFDAAHLDDALVLLRNPDSPTI